MDNTKYDSYFKKYFNLFPQYSDIIGPIASCHASLERAMNLVILKSNPNLANVPSLHFRYELAVKIICNMNFPFGLSKSENFEELLVSLNKARNNLVHPSKNEFMKIHQMLTPIYSFMNKKELVSEKDFVQNNYPEIVERYIGGFNSYMLGVFSASLEHIDVKIIYKISK